MGRNDFIDVFAESEVADLGPGVNIVDWLEGVCVPETDAAVCGAAA